MNMLNKRRLDFIWIDDLINKKIFGICFCLVGESVKVLLFRKWFYFIEK